MSWRPAAPGEGFECLTPRLVRNVGFVACKTCPRCRAARGRDWAGRAIAESYMADRSLFATLTVGGDDERGVEGNERAKEFHRDDVRAFVVRMRKYVRPGKVRMFWVGENGDRKGRVHYHMLLYFYGTRGPGDILLNKYFFHGKMSPGVVQPGSKIFHVEGQNTWWPWGLSYYREFHPRHAYYLATYVTKTYVDSKGNERAEYTRPGVSRNLGASWLRWYALRHVEQKLSPQDRLYRFPRETKVDADGSEKTFTNEYYMVDSSWRLFVRAFVDGWRLAYGNQPWPASPAVEQELERAADYAAGRVPVPWPEYARRHEKVVGEKAGLRDKRERAQRVRDAVSEAVALDRAGIKPVVKRDGVDDALNAALAIRSIQDGPTIAEQEAEWAKRFGRFEDHEKRWQAEVLHRVRTR